MIRHLSLVALLLVAQTATGQSSKACDAKPDLDDSVSLMQITNSLSKRTAPLTQPAQQDDAPTELVSKSTDANIDGAHPENITIVISGITGAPAAAPTLPPTLAPTLPATSAPTLAPTLAPTMPATLAPTLAPAAYGQDQGDNITIVINGPGMEPLTAAAAPSLPVATAAVAPAALPVATPVVPPAALPVAAPVVPPAAPPVAAAVVPPASPPVPAAPVAPAAPPVAAAVVPPPTAPPVAGSPSHVLNAASIIRNGVQTMAQAAAIQGVEIGVKQGVEIGVQEEGFSATGAAPPKPSGVAGVAAAGGAGVNGSSPVKLAASNVSAQGVLKSVLDGQMENNVTIVIQPIKTVGATTAR